MSGEWEVIVSAKGETAPSSDGWETIVPARNVGPASPAVVEKIAGTLGRKASAAMQRVMGTLEKGVDYGGLPDNRTQAEYSLLNDNESRTAYLTQKYGKDNVAIDKFGRDIVQIGDKKYSVKPVVPTPDRTALTYSSVAGEVLPTLGMIGGATIGSAAGPVTGSVMAGGGGAFGVAVNQLLARAIGLPVQQDSAAAAREMITQGAVPGLLGEGLTRGAAYIGRSALAPYKPGSILGPWQKNVPMYEQRMGEVKAATDIGLRPKVGTFAPNAVFTQRLQNAAFRLFGDELPELNRPVMEKASQGITNLATGFQTTGESAEAISGALSARAEQTAIVVEKNAAKAQAEAEALIKKSQDAISGKIGAPSGDLAANVEKDIRANRTDFGKKASELYAPIDEFAGGPVVPTQKIKDVLNGILKQMPPTKSGDVSVLVPENLKAFTKGINELPEYVTFQQMQAIRSKFYSKAETDALNAGLSDRQATQLARASDSAFDDATSKIIERKKTGILDSQGKPITTVTPKFVDGVEKVAQSLRRADQYWKSGIKRFDDLSVEALVKDASKTGYIQPEKVADYIAKAGETDKLLRIKKVVSPETFREVGSQVWNNTIRDAIDPMTGEVNGRILATRINSMNKNGMMDALYGPTSSDIKKLVQQYAALGGKIDAEVLGKGDIKTAIQNAIKAKSESDALIKSDWLSAIRDGGKQSLRAVEWLSEPNNRLQMRNAIKTFGVNSPEANAIREYTARNIFTKMEVPATKGAEKYAKTELMGKPLLDELDKYGKPYLTELFGKQWVDNAYGFAKAADIASRKNPIDSGGLIAASLGLHPIKNFMQLTKIFAGGEFLSSPLAIKYMTDGLAQGKIASTLKKFALGGLRGYALIEAEGMARGASNKINQGERMLERQ